MLISMLLPTTLLLLLVAAPHHVESLLLYGCNLSENLCEENEYCFPDGLFGQCYSEDSGAPAPTILDNLDDGQLELLKLELERLANQGQEWPDQRAQCVLAYYKLSIAYGLQYDPEFCQVRNPANIWALIQLIDLGLKEEALVAAAAEDEAALEEAIAGPEETVIPVDAIVDGEEAIVPVIETGEEQLTERQLEEIIRELAEPVPDIDLDDIRPSSEIDLSEEDALQVGEYLNEILAGRNPDLSALTDDQLNALIAQIFELKSAYANKNEPAQEAVEAVEEIAEEPAAQEEAAPVGEIEEAIPLDALADDQNVLKKDVEKIGDVRTGLDPNVHKIVKGKKSDITRVVGNRVYLKVNIKDDQQLLPLIEFLQNTIAIPNNLIFDDFTFENGQLSLRISRLPIAPARDDQNKPKDKRIDTVEGVAQAVYKRRKDIQKFSGADVAETGIGIGEESVPVAKAERDWLFYPVMFISVFTITSLASVMAVHMYRARRKNYSQNIRQLAEDLEGKSCLAYQELCRQRMSMDAGPIPQSKTSSTSSWCEEASQQPNIDISTGHVLLNFLQECLADSSRIDDQWLTLAEYRNNSKSTSQAEAHPALNRTVLPYDENLVPVTNADGTKDFLNASFIYDDDPRQAVCIAAQTPVPDAISAFWRAIWQNGVCLIVNLSTIEESKNERAYWPDKGSEIHGQFEIHLVSEHIWSDDYLVRSFYLKNLSDGQTRTITQFHYVSWRQDGAPNSPKSLLEFRRKVNKSYRGRASPLLVHSTNGEGRTGVYCAVDLICQRIQRGVKEIDIAASVEHLRDHRAGLVRTQDQYKFIYACVAQEVSALVKSLSQ